MKQRTDPKTWFAIEGGHVDYEADQFPDGSFRFQVDLADLDPQYPVEVTLLTTLPEAIVGLHQIVDALHDYTVHLEIQTFPDQRADRVEKFGQSVPAKVTARLIAALNVGSITVYDPHSEVFVQELQKYSTADVEVVQAAECFEYATAWIPVKADFVVAVDKGAKLRAETTTELLEAHVIYADKKRVDGKVVGHEIVGEAFVHPTDTIWVVDDLCDGGATFISIAKLLRDTYKFGELNLYITHGLFSKGKEELSKYFDNIIARFDYA